MLKNKISVCLLYFSIIVTGQLYAEEDIAMPASGETWHKVFFETQNNGLTLHSSSHLNSHDLLLTENPITDVSNNFYNDKAYVFVDQTGGFTRDDKYSIEFASDFSHLTTINPVRISIPKVEKNDSGNIAVEFSLIREDLSNQPFTASQLIIQTAELRAAFQSGKNRITPIFSEGASCLKVASIVYSRPVFILNAQKSPFKSLTEFEEKTTDFGKNERIITVDRGSWNNSSWVKVKAYGYEGAEYYRSAVKYKGSIYLASFKDSISFIPAFKNNCIAYNTQALVDLERYYSKPE